MLFIHAIHIVLSDTICPVDFSCKCRVVGDGADITAINIDCRSHNFSAIPDFSSIRNLSIFSIDLSWNRISSIPNYAFAGLHLVHGRYAPSKIHINANPLANISKLAFEGIKADGIELQIEYSDLKMFPAEALSQMSNLTALHFWSSDVNFIPDGSFYSFHRLVTLDLTGNKLPDLSSGLFRGLENVLENLYLRQMGLKEFPSTALQQLRMLRYLVLDENTISFLPDGIFYGFRTTSKSFSLSLQKNQMTNISSKAFAKTHIAVVDVDLTSNNLTDLSFLFDPCSLTFNFPNRILAYDNPLNCDCNMFSVLETDFYTFDGRCGSPKNLAGSYVQAQRGEISTPFVTLANQTCSVVDTWDLACATYRTSGSQTREHYCFLMTFAAVMFDIVNTFVNIQ